MDAVGADLISRAGASDAAGALKLVSGTTVQEVNQLIKQFEQMSKMMKMMQGGKGKHMMQMLQNMK